MVFGSLNLRFDRKIASKNPMIGGTIRVAATIKNALVTGVKIAKSGRWYGNTASKNQIITVSIKKGVANANKNSMTDQ